MIIFHSNPALPSDAAPQSNLISNITSVSVKIDQPKGNMIEQNIEIIEHLVQSIETSRLMELYLKPSALLLIFLFALLVLVLQKRLVQLYRDSKQRSRRYQRAAFQNNSAACTGTIQLEGALANDEEHQQLRELEVDRIIGASNDLIIMRHLAIADLLYAACVTFFWATNNFRLPFIVTGVLMFNIQLFRS